MKKAEVLKTVAAGAAVAALSGPNADGMSFKTEKQPGPRPNIIVIFTDQQSAAMMSCTGNRLVQTPAMDSLASTGARFEKAYSVNPVCVPSRTGMFTGCPPSRFRLQANNEIVQIDPEAQRMAMGTVFRSHGYETVYGGKQHLPGTEGEGAAQAMKDVYGFDEVIATAQRHELAAACSDFLKRPHDKPFLLVASFINPHDICYYTIDMARALKTDPYYYQAGDPEKGAYEYLAKALQKPAGVSGEEFYSSYCPPLPENFAYQKGEPEAVKKFNQRWSTEQWQLARWAYCRLTEQADRDVATVLRALSEQGLDDNTVVIFTSDHGEMDGAHRRVAKTYFYEEAARVPFIVSWKGVTKAGLVDRRNPVSAGLDLIPTICDYAEIIPPSGYLGHSVRPLADGKTADLNRSYVASEMKGGRMVCSGRYKYCVYETGTFREQLTDLEKDPGELVNVAGDPEYADVLLKHRGYMREWVELSRDAIADQYIIK
jgi:choline-sulfatase